MKPRLGPLSIVSCVIFGMPGCGLVKNPGADALSRLEDCVLDGASDPRDNRRLDEAVNDLAAYWRYSLNPVMVYFRSHWQQRDRRSIAANIAIESISRVRDRRAILQLVELAKQREDMISLPAVMSLRCLCDARDMGTIMAFVQDPNFKWKTQMVELLGKIAGGDETGAGEVRSVARKLIAQYLESDDRDVRRGAVFALKRTRDPGFAPRLQRVVKEDPDAVVRIAAAEALASLGDDRGRKYLLRILEASGDPEELARACFAARRLKLDEAVPNLGQLAQNGNEAVRPFAWTALAGMGTDDSLNVLKKLGLDPADPYQTDVNAHNRERANWL